MQADQANQGAQFIFIIAKTDNNQYILFTEKENFLLHLLILKIRIISRQSNKMFFFLKITYVRDCLLGLIVRLAFEAI